MIVLWHLLVNDRLVSQPEITKKSIKPPILAFEVIQGHWIRRQSKASIRFGEIKYSMVYVGAGVDIDMLNINEARPVKRDTCR